MPAPCGGYNKQDLQTGEQAMREILFRGKRLDTGEWVEGAYLLLNGEDHRIATSCIDGDDKNLLTVCAYPVDPDTVGQYTGLNDKYIRMIFEGDICLCDRHINDSFDKTKFEIKYDKIRGFYGESACGNEIFAEEFYMCEVTGNRYDNPEMMEVTP